MWNHVEANSCNIKVTESKNKNTNTEIYMSEFDSETDESLMITEAFFVESIVQTTRQIQELNMAAGGPTSTSMPKESVKSFFNTELSTMFPAPLEADKQKDILKIYVKGINVVDVVFGISKLRMRIYENINKEIMFTIYKSGDIYGISTIKLTLL